VHLTALTRTQKIERPAGEINESINLFAKKQQAASETRVHRAGRPVPERVFSKIVIHSLTMA